MFEVTYFSGKYHSFYLHLLALMTFMQVFCTLEATCIVLKMSTFNAIFSARYFLLLQIVQSTFEVI